MKPVSAPPPSISLGVDAVDLERFREVVDHGGEHFLRRVYTMRELKCCDGQIGRLGAVFAGKEATAKALGQGVLIIGLTNIEILTGDRGAPRLVLHGRARELARTSGLDHWNVALAGTPMMATAIVLGQRSEP